MGPVVLVVMLVTLKGVLDAGTRSNLRYVFALLQFLLFLVFKSGLDVNPRIFIQRIINWIYGILLFQALIIWIYLSKSSGMDFGYVYIGSVGLSLLASALLLLSGKLLTSLARWSMDWVLESEDR
jgi:apolipoprotein N-acyltransferase